MIYRERMEKKVLEFCILNGINTRLPIRDDKTKDLIRQFIATQTKADKNSGKEREYERKISIKSIGMPGDTPIEQHLYNAMIKEKIDKYFIPQYSEGPYTMDFASREFMIGVECDGKDFHTAEHQVERDKNRDAYLSRCGWKMIRIEGVAIVRTPQYCIEKIKKIMGLKNKTKG